MSGAEPIYVVPVTLDGQIVLRVYRGGRLEIAVPLRWRRALVLASDILNAALVAERSCDRLEFEPTQERRVAGKVGYYNHGG